MMDRVLGFIDRNMLSIVMVIFLPIVPACLTMWLVNKCARKGLHNIALAVFLLGGIVSFIVLAESLALIYSYLDGT